jgi:hypothetical protein
MFLNQRDACDDDLLHSVLAQDQRHERRARDAQAHPTAPDDAPHANRL